MADTAEAQPPKKKKGGIVKILILVLAVVLLIGGGVGGGLYAAQAGLFSGGGKSEHADGPRLVPKSDEERATLGGEGEGGDHGQPTPEGQGGDKYASSYYAMDKEFTANLQDSVHFLQIGLAVSTPYDKRVLENLKTHEIAVRSAILMALGETTEDQVFTADGKKQLQKRLAVAINGVLKEKEGFGGIGNVYFTNFIVQ